ncbi:MAG TPA: BamA/TamA family outer membrane protein [Blastocatellia bacterium]|nr:BamA/TamA family outer membrane protein [Blastocatellia bacterium]
MINKSKNVLWGCMSVIALSALVSMSKPCMAQVTDATHSALLSPAPSRTSGSSVSAAEETKGTRDSATTQSTPQSGNPQGGILSLASRVKSFSRNGPTRETWNTFDLGSKYVRAVVGGFEQGALIGLGVQLTTADSIRFVEFRVTALTTPNLYRRFEGEAYFPRVFGENTHADVWFDYLRRTKDNFFGIGSLIPKTSQTNFDLEQRSYNASLYHDFAEHLQIGGYFSLSNSATYRGQKDRDIPIDILFSGDPSTVPVARWAPGLLTNAKILSYGGFAEYDLRNSSGGLTRGAYFYGRIGSSQGLKDKPAFSDYGWLEAELDARSYIPLGSDKTSLAIRGYASLKDPRSGSQIPFYDLSFLGGRMYGRGFQNFRYRGNNVVLGSAELRQTVWTQSEERGLDVFAFGDGGQVWGDNRSRTDPSILANQDFDSRNWRASVGGGFQYRYSKSFAGRVEIGHSHERNLIYFSITRGF